MRPTETAAATRGNGGGGATENSTVESSGREALSLGAVMTDSSPPSLDLSLGGGDTMRSMTSMNQNQQFLISPLAGRFSGVTQTPVMNPFQSAVYFNALARHDILKPEHGILDPHRITEAVDFLGIAGANAVQRESDSSSVVIKHNREINLDLDLNLPPPPENA
ncbi:hypothetical protein ACH5RR_015145 [Cinchona calisaya]|uniref:Uncharacterized protein n=1 Tax=Cinchona calisaya TaxID=153742 RepID=A0ABD2ZU19_9GENT